MPKTQRELAFLTDLFIADDWTRRFTELADKYIDLSDSENLVYIKAGTGMHAMAIAEKYAETTDVFAACDNEDLLSIALDKAAAVSSKVDFSTIRFEDDAFDAVLADGSFVPQAEVAEFVEDAVRVARTSGDVAVLLPSAGSYGEVFSLLWEVLISENLIEHAAAVERLIADIPTIAAVEGIAKSAGMVNIHTEMATEMFEFENGAEFIGSPLVEDFLLPYWLETLDENERTRVSTALIKLIDSEEGSLPFRFSVKATLLTGEKS